MRPGSTSQSGKAFLTTAKQDTVGKTEELPSIHEM